MKDVFDAYKQQKMKKNITIVAFALLFGIGINVFLPSPTNILSSVTNF
jgi:xanthine/uracil permease